MTPRKASYRTILLTKRQKTIVDCDTYLWANDFNWHAHWNKHTSSYYAVRRTTVNGKRGRIFLHRAILGLEQGDVRQGDHWNGNTLDNRRANLRVATPAQNTQNSKMRSDNSTGFRGAYRVRNSNRWWSKIVCNKVYYSLGTFDSAEEASNAYREAATRLHGEFAYTNKTVVS